MIVKQEFWIKSSKVDIDLIRSLAERYKPFASPQVLNSWTIRGFPDLVLMEGGKISSHKDGGDFWQPFLVLKNSPPYWSFRGSTQKVRTVEPQILGSIVLIDIQKSHCVTGSSSVPWLILCWNPSGSVPEKASFNIDEVLYKSKSEFSRFLNSHLRFA